MTRRPSAARLLPTGAPSGTVDSASRVLLRPRGGSAGVATAAMDPSGHYLLGVLIKVTHLPTMKGVHAPQAQTTMIAVNVVSGRFSPLPIRLTHRVGLGGIAW